MQQTFEWEMVIFNQSCSYVLLQIVVALYLYNPLLQLASATLHYFRTAVFHDSLFTKGHAHAIKCAGIITHAINKQSHVG